jgi:hypothetical protein
MGGYRFRSEPGTAKGHENPLITLREVFQSQVSLATETPTKSKNSRHGKAHRPAMNLPQDLNIQEDSKYLDDALSQKAFRVI